MACVDDSLAHGASMLASHGLECLPVGDGACSSSLLHLLLPEQIVLFLATLPEFSAGYAGLLEQPVGQALLPLCRPLKTVHRNTSLIDALALLSAERIDALPIVDDGAPPLPLLSAWHAYRAPPPPPPTHPFSPGPPHLFFVLQLGACKMPSPAATCGS